MQTATYSSSNTWVGIDTLSKLMADKGVSRQRHGGQRNFIVYISTNRHVTSVHVWFCWNVNLFDTLRAVTNYCVFKSMITSNCPFSVMNPTMAT